MGKRIQSNRCQHGEQRLLRKLTQRKKWKWNKPTRWQYRGNWENKSDQSDGKITKKDEDNPDYISIVLCSKGLGANYAKENQLKHRWNKEKTIITYKTHNGQDLPLPRYYKTTIYTDDQRQLLWLYAENKGVKWVKGFEVIGANTVNKDYYERLLKEKNENGIGLHGDNIEEIERKKAINRMEKLQKKMRTILTIYQ